MLPLKRMLRCDRMKNKYIYSGMYVGMLLGLIIGNAFKIEYGCMAFGIVLGWIIGKGIDYKVNNRQKKENKKIS